MHRPQSRRFSRTCKRWAKNWQAILYNDFFLTGSCGKKNNACGYTFDSLSPSQALVRFTAKSPGRVRNAVKRQHQQQSHSLNTTLKASGRKTQTRSGGVGWAAVYGTSEPLDVINPASTPFLPTSLTLAPSRPVAPCLCWPTPSTDRCPSPTRASKGGA